MNTYCLVQETKLSLCIHVFRHLKHLYWVFMHFGTSIKLFDILKQTLIQREQLRTYALIHQFQQLSTFVYFVCSILSHDFFQGLNYFIFLYIIIYYVNKVIFGYSTTQCFCWLFVIFIHVWMSSCKEFTLLLYRIPLYAHTTTCPFPSWLTLQRFAISCTYIRICS